MKKHEDKELKDKIVEFKLSEELKKYESLEILRVYSREEEQKKVIQVNEEKNAVMMIDLVIVKGESSNFLPILHWIRT